MIKVQTTSLSKVSVSSAKYLTAKIVCHLFIAKNAMLNITILNREKDAFCVNLKAVKTVVVSKYAKYVMKKKIMF